LRHWKTCPTIHHLNFRDKIIAWENLPAWRALLRASGKDLVVTNGVSILLHAGHVTYLATARHLGDTLLVGLNGDDSVRQLKGDARPVNPEADRATVLAALQSVDAVCIFAEKNAARFLARRTAGHLREGRGLHADHSESGRAAGGRAPEAGESCSSHLCPGNPPRRCLEIISRL